MNEFDIRWHDAEWIEKMNEKFIPIANENNRIYRRKENQRLCHKKGAVKYSKSEKGKISRFKRHFRIRKCEMSLSGEELQMINEFYENCPSGFEIHHIIPLSHGGRHEMANLQYIEKTKHYQIDHKNFIYTENYPCCLI